MPSNCPGLNIDDIEIVIKDIPLNGQTQPQTFADVGSVVLKFDIRPDGTTTNIRAVKSNHHCFEAPAKNSVEQWVIKPQEKHIHDVGILLKFRLTAEPGQSPDELLRDFVQ